MKSKKIAGFLIVIAVVVVLSVIFFLPKLPTNKIAIIEIHTDILSSETRDSISNMIEYALRNDSIKAVVLDIDCRGGEVSAVEEIYLSVLNLKKEKPVVASIHGMGASGGYYIALASDYIYALPSSKIGSIGVIGYVPKEGKVDEDIIDTGRYKRIGYSEKDYPFKIQSILDKFLDVVEEQRGDKLKISRSDLSKALIYFGSEALEYGLVDEIGTKIDAINRAAKLAKIKDYEVVELNYVVREQITLHLKSIDELKSISQSPAFYYIYLSYPSSNETSQPITGGKGVVIIDYSHNNNFQIDKIQLLLSKVVESGYSIRYTQDLEKLNRSNALIVISPRKPFDESEIEKITGFVENGGKLLIVYDPSKANASVVNTLATNFGLFFANGYLYNPDENYGNYRNIVVNSFKDLPAKKLVFFTATYLVGNGIAFTTNNTYFSGSNTPSEYAVVAIKDNVMAIGDQTFLEEPYCYVEDNSKFIEFIAKFLID